jgi:2-keto-4-pentenoate hydratase/2-oxohepta-3-ene-1,7-dioic acid hydratase in catechol pathway
MKFGRFELQGKTFFGLVEGEQVTELDGSPFDTCKATAKKHALSTLKVLLPFEPQTFYCAGLNYAAHVEWGNRRKGTNTKLPEKADIGYRANNALIATGEPIVIPADSPGPVQFEGELVAVIGKTARHLTEANALDCVLGYTLGNDVSERTWQKADRTMWRSKNCDSFKPLGPFVTTGLDPLKQTVSIDVNGVRVASYSTGKMLFTLQHFIARITRYSTLHPGDMIWLGTDEATEPDLKHGDTVEIICEPIGVLRNPVVRAKD